MSGTTSVCTMRNIDEHAMKVAIRSIMVNVLMRFRMRTRVTCHGGMMGRGLGESRAR